MSESNFDDVGRFHQKFDLPNVTYDGAYPRHPLSSTLDFRIRFLWEEFREFLEAQGIEVVTPPLLKSGFRVSPDHAKMFDALLDLVYVAMGTAHLLGYPWQEGWNRVQTANMQKVRAKPDGSDSKRGSSFDVVKPAGWRPPDIAGLLREYGWGPLVTPTEEEENDR